jgi:CRISPR-associated protein Cmr4
MMHNRIYYLHALSALHAGTGQGSGVIDLPIAREKSTGLPVVPGSSVKGVLREELEGRGANPNAQEHQALFGPKTDKAYEHAGALAFGDARLLCLPVRSLSGTFAWATSPMVLRRYLRDLQMENPPAIPALEEGEAEACPGSKLLDGKNRLFLEDLDLQADKTKTAQDWAEKIGQAVFDANWQTLFTERFAILSDAEFDFLAETATEITARIRLDDTRTVAKGGLWYEESLPAETLLWGVAACDRSRFGAIKQSGEELLKHLPAEARLQIGGKASVGRGQARWILAAQQGGQ